MIGIIAAMNVEMESLRSFMTDMTTETISGITFVSGTLEGKQVVTAVCGIGKVFAAMCAQTMILRYQPECIVNTGVAGTLSDKLTIGSIAVSSAVVQHDMDTSAIGDPVGLISGINKVLLPADQALKLVKSFDADVILIDKDKNIYMTEQAGKQFTITNGDYKVK